MNAFWLDVFQRFDREEIQYCLMRDTQDEAAPEVDVLVYDAQAARCSELLLRLGFLALPSFGYAPHRFFVAYDRGSDRWYKLDMVVKVAYGSPIPVLYTELAEDCLKSRRRSGEVYVPAPECELLTLMMHCVLDKGAFSPAHVNRLKALRHLVTDEHWMTSLLKAYWLPTTTWALLAEQIDVEDWAGLLAGGGALRARLMAGQRVAVAARGLFLRGQRKLNRFFTTRSPRSIKAAILAPDGAGKSTLVAGICNSYFFPVRSIYMGLYQRGGTRRRMSALPGASFAARLLSLWGRCLEAQYHQARRRLVIFDRYSYDALLAPQRQPGALAVWRRRILAHACPAPELVIVLDAPGEALYARKGEHSAELLEWQRQQYLALGRNLAQLVVVDATQGADQVRRDVLSLIWDVHVKRQIRLLGDRIEQAVAI